MKVRLLHPDRDFDPSAAPPPQAATVAQDLGLDIVIGAMAADDETLRATAQAVLLAATGAGDAQSIAHRQAGLADALEHAQAVRALYALAMEAVASRRRHYLGFELSDRAPSSALFGAIELLDTFVGWMRKLRDLVDAQQDHFRSAAFTGLFASVRENIDAAYLAAIDAHLETLRFRQGVLLDARLGAGNTGSAYRLRLAHAEPHRWLQRLLGQTPPAYTWRLAERDEAGARILRGIRDRGITDTASTLAQSAKHVLHFFETLRAELAFYVGALNLHERLQAAGVATCLPAFAPIGARQLQATGLCNPVLALCTQSGVVASDCAADGMDLLLVTGANQGGKSTFLRALGLAQVMLHTGLFVAADRCGHAAQRCVQPCPARGRRHARTRQVRRRAATHGDHRRPGASRRTGAVQRTLRHDQRTRGFRSGHAGVRCPARTRHRRLLRLAPGHAGAVAGRARRRRRAVPARGPPGRRQPQLRHPPRRTARHEFRRRPLSPIV